MQSDMFSGTGEKSEREAGKSRYHGRMRHRRLKVPPEEEEAVSQLGGLDRRKVYHGVYPMPTLATKIPEAFARRVRDAAAAKKTTVSSFVRKAIENEMAGRPVETFGQKFGHLFGAGSKLPANASKKEGYED
jgi:hypothetical protein